MFLIDRIDQQHFEDARIKFALWAIESFLVTHHGLTDLAMYLDGLALQWLKGIYGTEWQRSSEHRIMTARGAELSYSSMD